MMKSSLDARKKILDELTSYRERLKRSLEKANAVYEALDGARTNLQHASEQDRAKLEQARDECNEAFKASEALPRVRIAREKLDLLDNLEKALPSEDELNKIESQMTRDSGSALSALGEEKLADGDICKAQAIARAFQPFKAALDDSTERLSEIRRNGTWNDNGRMMNFLEKLTHYLSYVIPGLGYAVRKFGMFNTAGANMVNRMNASIPKSEEPSIADLLVERDDGIKNSSAASTPSSVPLSSDDEEASSKETVGGQPPSPLVTSLRMV